MGNFIFKVVGEYHDSKGAFIRENEIISGKKPDDFPRFTGQIQVMFGTPAGNIPHTVNFPISAGNIEEAFRKFEKESKEAIADAAKNFEAQLRERMASRPKVQAPPPGLNLKDLPPHKGRIKQ